MLKMISRNIWRNKRRTLITAASVFFAVFFASVMVSSADGMWGKLIESTLYTQSGHIELHGKGYWDDKVVDNFMAADSSLIARLDALPGVANISPRVETFAMAASVDISKGIAVTGISPSRENAKCNLAGRLVHGEYLEEDDDGILIGQGLGEYLNAGVGDTLALIGQGWHGMSAAGLFPVRGVMKLITQEMDNSMAYVSLPAAQSFISMPDGCSGILIALQDDGLLDESMREVIAATDTSKVDVLSWHVTMERLLQQSESDKAMSKLIVVILYIIVGFGIFGTVVMMTNERRREFSVLVSLGMSRRRLAATVVAEVFCIAMMGVAAALLVSWSLAFWFNTHPIEFSGQMAQAFLDLGMEPLMPMDTSPSLFLRQALVVAVMVALAVIYPARNILQLNLTRK